MRAKPLQFQRKSPDRASDDHVTPSKANVGRTPIGDAVIALMPWSADPCAHDNRAPFPGVHGFIQRLTGGRASIRAVQRWANGSRSAPRWFVAVLRDQLLVRRAAIDAALDGLAPYEFGPGHGYGLRDYWRRRHESEQLRH